MQFLKRKKFDYLHLLNAPRILPYGNESVVKRIYRKNTAGRQQTRYDSHAAADQFPVRWRSDFNWTPLYIRTYIVDHMYTQFRVT